MKQTVIIEKQKFKAVIDTGSTVSLVHPRVVSRLSLVPKKRSATQVLLLDQTTEQLEYSVRLEVEIDNEIHYHNCYVYPKLNFEILFGLDFCRKTGIVIDFSKELIQDFGESELFNKFKSAVRLTHEYTLPAKTTSKLSCKIEFDMDLGLFKPNKRLLENYLLVAHECIIQINQKNCEIFICNPTNQDIILFENYKIGEISEVSNVISMDKVLLIHENKIEQSNLDFNVCHGSDTEKKIISDLLENNRDIFGDTVGHLQQAINVEHKIDLTTDQPIAMKPYRTSPLEQKIIKEQIEEMLENKIIQPSSSSYAFPVVLVEKKNGKKRFCIDYRKLNAVTIKDKHPLPIISDSLSMSFKKTKYFSVIDLLSGYWNVMVKETDRHKTAFITTDGLYEWLRMPFGLSNSPATFQRFMQKVLQQYLYRSILVYLDDIIIFSNTFEEHVEHLQEVFNKIREYKLKLSIEKCKFLCKEVVYLGHIVSREGILPCDDKVKAVRQFPIPSTKKELQSFLGLANYYRIFIKDYAHISDPLNKITGKKSKFNWSTECQNAFDTLKDKLTTAPVLARFNPEYENEMFTDACLIGFSAILGQRQDNKSKVIAYNSGMFNPAQTKYTITEKECYAVIYGYSKYHHYIHGLPVTVYTDHKPLEHIDKVKVPSERLYRWSNILSLYEHYVVYKEGKKHQNADALSRCPCDPPKPYDIDHDLVHLVETKNEVAQDTSESDEDIQEDNDHESNELINTSGHTEPVETESEKEKVNKINRSKVIETMELKEDKISETDVDTIEALKREQKRDPFCLKYINAFISNKKIKAIQKFKYENDILFRRNFTPFNQPKLDIVVPYVLRINILMELHDDPTTGGHLGITKTIYKVRQRFWWPNLIQTIHDYIVSCKSCQENKPDFDKSLGLANPDKPKEEPFHTVSIDVHGPINPPSTKGNKYIVLLVDHFTKWIELKAVKNIRTDTIAQWLCDEVVLRHGGINFILTDNAKYFNSKYMTELIMALNSTHINSTPYAPQSNGIAEKSIGTIVRMLKHYVKKGVTDDLKVFRRWDTWLPRLQFAYNISVHTSTRWPPFTLLYQREVKLPLDIHYEIPRDFKFGKTFVESLTDALDFVKFYMRDAQMENKRYYDEKHVHHEFNVGDLVGVKLPNRMVGISESLLNQIQGPFKVVEKVTPLVYRVQDADGKRAIKTLHIRRLKKWRQGPILGISKPNATEISDKRHV